jgi:hypothetical protein
VHNLFIFSWLLDFKNYSYEFPVNVVDLCYLFKCGIWVTRKQCYVCRPCDNQRTRRRHSAFWIVSMNECQKLVLEMMAAVRNKQPFYQQGLMAMMLREQPL